MMCDYLDLKNTDPDLYRAGAEAWSECGINNPEEAEVYKNSTWMYPYLDRVSKTEMKKIFVKMKDLLDRGLVSVSYRFFLYQFCELVKAAAPNAPELQSVEFQKLVACGDAVKLNLELSQIVFSLN